MKSKYIGLAIFMITIAFAGIVRANGFGLTLDKVVGDYTANIDYDAVYGIYAGDPVQFAFQLFTKDRSKSVDFTDAWVTVAPVGADPTYTPPVFDGGILGGSDLAPSGMTFVFPKSGKYNLTVRYDKAD